MCHRQNLDKKKNNELTAQVRSNSIDSRANKYIFSTVIITINIIIIITIMLISLANFVHHLAMII